MAKKTTSEQVEQDAFQACRDIAGTFGVECATKWNKVAQNENAPGKDCYLAAVRDVLGLRLPEHESYKPWEEASIEGGIRVMHPEFCIVCDFPETIKVDDQHRPHCSDGPSHRWRDGWALYHWHGVRIPEEWVTNPGTLTAAVAAEATDPELRQAACEMLEFRHAEKRDS